LSILSSPAPSSSELTNTDYTNLLSLTSLEENLGRIFTEAFHTESLDVKMPFLKMGGTSLDAIQALWLIRQKICTKIDVGLFFAKTL
jgi:hypothetical protein